MTERIPRRRHQIERRRFAVARARVVLEELARIRAEMGTAKRLIAANRQLEKIERRIARWCARFDGARFRQKRQAGEGKSPARRDRIDAARSRSSVEDHATNDGANQ